jgi:hypothetical protein
MTSVFIYNIKNKNKKNPPSIKSLQITHFTIKKNYVLDRKYFTSPTSYLYTPSLF